MRKILVLITSSHNSGNTAALAGSFIEGAQAAGHEIHRVFMGNMQINGCTGCNACHLNGGICVQKDGMTGIYTLLEQCDTVVLASPLYYFAISAKAKAFIERLYARGMKDDDPPFGRYERYDVKDSILLMSAADDTFWAYSQAEAYYRMTMINYIGWRDCGMVLAGGCSGIGVPAHVPAEYLRKAYELGLSLN